MLQLGAPQPVFGEGQLKYDPTNEWIFPSVVRTSRLPADGLGAWHMYYSPHDPPGGICLAYADRLTGPWTEYEGNPVISREWQPNYEVSHVAAPHALWLEDEKRLGLWFHGENDVTRRASSTDGVHFSYDGIALRASDFGDSQECSYGRVFEHRVPSCPGSRYVMMLMGNLDFRRVLQLAWSADAMAWTPLPQPFILVPEELGGHGASPWLVRLDGQLHIVYHSGRFIGDPSDYNIDSDFCGVPVGDDLRPCGPHRTIHRAREGYPDFRRVQDFVLVTDEDGNDLVFYVAGRRLKGRLFVMPVTGRSTEPRNPNQTDAVDGE